MDFSPPPKLWFPKPGIIRAASMEEVERAARRANFLPGMAGVAGMKAAGAVAAFPAVVTTNVSQEPNNVSSHAVALPASIVAGNRQIVFFAAGQSSAMAVTTPAGWNLRLSLVTNAGSSTVRLVVFDRIADGGEGSTLTVTTTGSTTRTAHNSYQISGGGTPEIGTATGESTTPNPPSLSPTGGSKNYLWLAGCFFADSESTPSAAPSNYTNLLDSAVMSSGQGSACRAASARRELAAASDDPGTFTLSASRAWIAATMAIPPA